MYNRRETIWQLVNEALNRASELELSELIRKATRIARLQADYRNIAWLEREMMPHDARLTKNELRDELLQGAPNWDTLKKIWAEDSLRIIEERAIPARDSNDKLVGEPRVLGLSVSDMEHALKTLRNEMKISGSIPHGVPPDQIASYHQRAERARLSFDVGIADRQAILDRIRQRVLRYLNQAEALILYQESNSEIFESAKKVVESELATIAPDVLTKLKVAQERISDGSAEALSHALTTSRRVLKAFADTLYPAREDPVLGGDGKTRTLGDDQYIARLWQYVFELAGRHSNTNITLAVLDNLGARIDSVYKLSNKGVHDEIIDYEAKQCVIQTFLVLADILAFRMTSNSKVSATQS